MSLKNRINKILRPLNVQVHGLGYLQSLGKGDFKKDEFDFFKQIFGDRPITIYDIGANRGSTIAKFVDYFPGARIVAFEPIVSLCEEIKSKFENYKNINIENTGISNFTGEQIFFVNKSIDTSSFLPSQKAGLNSDSQVKNIAQINVPVKTIAQSYIEQKIEQIHILKLDIQGSELNALNGAEDLLAHKKIDVIYTEAYFIQQYIDHPLFADITLYLSKFGYQLQDIYNPIYGNDKLAWCDAVFVREDL